MSPIATVPACPPRGKDPCCVLTAELAPIVRAFAERWTREHPELAGCGGRPRGSRRNGRGQFGGNDVVGAITVLRERTLLEGGVGIGRDTIRNVLKERNRTTELWVADALLCAVGEWGALSDGRVEIRPNRTASRLARVEAARRGMTECCFEWERRRPDAGGKGQVGGVTTVAAFTDPIGPPLPGT